MKFGGLLKQIDDLSERVPEGYRTFDENGGPAIVSALDALDWCCSSLDLLRSRGREAEKKALREALERSVGEDNCHGRLYELVAAFAAGIED